MAGKVLRSKLLTSKLTPRPPPTLGDWANYVPGPYAFKTPEYPEFFYIRALEITTKFATRLGMTSDATYYGGLAAAARTLYQTTFYNTATGCYANCTYVSQVLALTLDLPSAADEPLVWSNAMDWWRANGTKGIPEHFGGGIISLKYAMPLLDSHGETGLALKMHLQTDEAPGFGYWIKTGGATTLWEAYNMDNITGNDSRNHIMFGGAGSWYYSALGGLGRALSSRSWQDLVISPPGAADVLNQLSYASTSIDTPMGLASTSWAVNGLPPSIGDVCQQVEEKAVMHLVCKGGLFRSVAFASYGNPSGSCTSSQFPPSINPACNSNQTHKVVLDLCVGKSECLITASNGQFNGPDPCFDVPKKLIVALNGNCEKGLTYALETTVPVGGRAVVSVPALGGPFNQVVVTEGSTIVWQAGTFVPGVSGIFGASAGTDAIIFNVGSGSFNFTLT